MSFVRETQHVARKAGRCEACRQQIVVGIRYTRWAGVGDDGFDTAAFHSDCREWEIGLCRAAGLASDEWLSLHEHVSEGGPAVLDDAPGAVRARFGLPANPATAGRTVADVAGEIGNG